MGLALPQKIYDIALKGKMCEDKGHFISIYNNLIELYLTCFKWNNLPSTVNQRYLELSLLTEGNCIFLYDENIGFLGLRGNIEGSYNVYYEPIKMRVYGGGGYQKICTNHKDAVIIYNNYTRTSPIQRIIYYANAIYNLERTIDINIHAQRTPILIKTDKKQEYTLKNIYKNYDDYSPVIFADKNISDYGSLEVIKTDAPFIANQLQEQKKQLWFEILSYLGIENNSSEKKERLTQGEVLVSNGLAISNRNSRFQSRVESVEEINKLFNLEIEVDVNIRSIFDVKQFIPDEIYKLLEGDVNE